MSVIPNARLLAVVSDPLGDVSFAPSAGAVLYYELRAYAEGTVTPIVGTKYLGPQTANPVTGLIKVNAKTMLNALPPGNYDIIIAAIGAGGTDESAHGLATVVPLQP